MWQIIQRLALTSVPRTPELVDCSSLILQLLQRASKVNQLYFANPNKAVEGFIKYFVTKDCQARPWSEKRKTLNARSYAATPKCQISNQIMATTDLHCDASHSLFFSLLTWFLPRQRLSSSRCQWQIRKTQKHYYKVLLEWPHITRRRWTKTRRRGIPLQIYIASFATAPVVCEEDSLLILKRPSTNQRPMRIRSF